MRFLSGVHRPASTKAAAAIVSLLAFAVYAATAAPTVFWGDSAELATSVYFLGIPHPTGYPLYSLIGKLFITVAPLGDTAYRMNLLSGVFGALTVGVIFLALKRLVGDWKVAATVALSLAFSYRFWRNSIITEIYTLHTLFLALFLLLLFLWRETGQKKYAYFTSAVFGLSLAHHGMTVLLTPALLFGIFFLRPAQWRPRELAATAGLSIAGLSLYAYLPLRYAQHPLFNLAEMVEADLTRPLDLLSYISGGLFRAQITVWDAERIYSQLGAVLAAAVADYMIIGALLAYAGALVQYKRDPKLLILLLTVLLPNLAFLAAYPVPDIEDFAVVLTVIISPWVATGLSFVCSWISRYLATQHPPIGWRRRYHLSPLLLLGLLVLAPFLSNLGYLNYRDKYAASHYAREILASLPDRAVLLMQFPAAPLWYAQLVEGRRPDVTLVDRTFLFLKKRALSRESKREEVISQLNSELLDKYKEQPLFLISYDPDIASAWSFEEYGLFYKLQYKGRPLVKTPDAGQTSGDLIFGNSLRLQTTTFEPSRVVAGRLVKLKLGWFVENPLLMEEVKLLFRFEASNEATGGGEQGAFSYQMPQGYGTWRAHEWPTGQLVEESYDLYVPMSVTAGSYRLRLMLYNGDTILQAFDGTGAGPYTGVLLGEIVVVALRG